MQDEEERGREELRVASYPDTHMGYGEPVPYSAGGTRIDLNGDGYRETVGYDTTGDGRVDALDTAGDEVYE